MGKQPCPVCQVRFRDPQVRQNVRLCPYCHTPLRVQPRWQNVRAFMVLPQLFSVLVIGCYGKALGLFGYALVSLYLLPLCIPQPYEVCTEAEASVPQRLPWRRNCHTAAAAGLLAGLCFYCCLELVVRRETYATGSSFLWFLGGGALLSMGVWVWLLRAGIPATENAWLSGCIGMVAAFALYPGLLRLNQLTDMRGLQQHTYRLQTDLRLQPDDPRLPTLVFPRGRDYWASLTPGSVHTFAIRQGGFGFYQIVEEVRE